MCLMFLYACITAQITVSESFEGTTLPTGWASTDAAGTAYTSNSYNTNAGTACAGTKAINKNLYSFTSSWYLIYSSTASNATALTYSFKYLAKGYSTTGSVSGNIAAEYSVDGGTTWTSLLATTTLSSPNATPIPCTTVSGTIPAGTIPTGANFKFRIKMNYTSPGDYYMGIDDVQLNQVATNPPSCTTISTPANAATGVAVLPTITWATASGASSYDIAIGTSAGGTNILPLTNVTGTSYTLTNALMYNTVYYVTVYPKNSFGSATGCTSNSFTTSAVPCPTVTSPSAGATGVGLTPTITWTAVTGASGYKLSVGTTAGGTDVLNAQDLGNVTSYTFSSPLNLQTQYYYTLNAYQGANLSVSCTERNFTTQCNAISSLPWTENFDAMTTLGAAVVPSCWANVTGSYAWTSMSSTTTTYNTPRSTPNYMTIAYSNTTASQLWTPAFQLTAGTSYDLSFYYNTGGTGSSYVGYTGNVLVNNSISTTGATDLGTFITATQGTTAGAAGYVKVTKTFVPATSGVYMFAVNVSSTSAPWYLGVDDFRLETTPSCAAPTTLTSGSITVSGATVSWPAPTPAPANGYNIYYSTTNTAPTATTTPSATVAAGVTTYNISGLTSNTTYYVWVRSNCGSGSTSSWAGPLSFTTACTSTNVPYTQDFESVTTPALPSCTSIENAGTGNNWTTSSPAAYGFTTKALTYLYNSLNAANAWFYTQGINLTAGVSYRIKYTYGNNSTTYVEKLKVAYGTSASSASMTNALADHSNINTATAATNFVDFTPAASGVYYFGFNAYSAADQYNLYVDDISIVVTPTCSEPSAVTVPAATLAYNSAVVNWTAPATAPANGYDVYYSTTNTAPTATTTPTLSGLTAATTTLSNLTPSTTYYLWVRSNCSASDQSIWVPVTFTTKSFCPTVTAPSAAATNVSVTPTFTWTAVTGVSGYKLSIGTSAGATNIMNAQDLGNVTTYTLPTALSYNTTYYYTLNAYDATSTSPGCTERSFTTAPPPPANDDCSGAIALTPGGTFAQNAVVSTNAGATATSDATATHSCQTTGYRDVWYSVVVPASGNITIETQSVSGSNVTDTVLGVYSGSCGALTQIGCDDDSSADGNFSLVSLTGLTPGSTLMIGVWNYSSSTTGQFKVSAYDASLVLATNEVKDAKNNIKVYPNPFSEVLNISDVANVKNVLVTDIAGRLVKTIANPTSELHLGELKQGMYLVTLEMKDGSKQTIKTIKK